MWWIVGSLVMSRGKTLGLITSEGNYTPCVMFEKLCDTCRLACTASFVYEKSKKWRTERNFRHYHRHADIEYVDALHNDVYSS